MGLAGGDLTLQAGDQELGVTPGFAPGPVGEALGGVHQCRILQCAGVEGQVGGGLLASAAAAAFLGGGLGALARFTSARAESTRRCGG